jgi:hypothetical protein
MLGWMFRLEQSKKLGKTLVAKILSGHLLDGEKSICAD